MENEEIYEIEEITDSTEIISNEAGDETISIDDVSEVENVPEKIILDDTDLEQNVDLVPELVPDPSQQEQSLEAILKQYFSKSTSDSDNFDNVEFSESEQLVGIGLNELDETPIDYTSLLEDILQSSSDTYDTVNDIYSMATDYDVNNQLSSDVDDISLSNMLLITLIIVMMFNGVMDFARRIF